MVHAVTHATDPHLVDPFHCPWMLYTLHETGREVQEYVELMAAAQGVGLQPVAMDKAFVLGWGDVI